MEIFDVEYNTNPIFAASMKTRDGSSSPTSSPWTPKDGRRGGGVTVQVISTSAINQQICGVSGTPAKGKESSNSTLQYLKLHF